MILIFLVYRSLKIGASLMAEGGEFKQKQQSSVFFRRKRILTKRIRRWTYEKRN